MTKERTPSKKMIMAVADEMQKRLQTQTPHDFATQWEVPLNYNDAYYRKHKPDSPVTYDVLRGMSRYYEVARACINIRKRQISQLTWDIVPREEKASNKSSNDVETLKAYFSTIGGHGTKLRKFLEQIVEDYLVIDGVSLYKRRTLGGALLGLLPVDPTTIKLRVDSAGMTPMPPEFAYEQWIRGSKVAEFTTNDMIYDMMNPRTDNPYGLSVMESLVMTVEAALKGNMYALAYFTDGTMPEGFYQLPEAWTADQIKQFQSMFDAMIAGDARLQRRIHFMPAGGKGFEAAKSFSFEGMQPFLEWLMRLTAAMFNVSPQELGFTDKVNLSNGVEQTETVKRNGIRNMAMVIQELINGILWKEEIAITDQNGKVVDVIGPFPDLQFKFLDIDPSDELVDAQIMEKLIPLGVYSVDEWRKEKGLDPIGVPNYIRVGNSVILATDVGKQLMQPTDLEATPEQDKKDDKKPDVDEMQDAMDTTPQKELKRWEKKALTDLKEGRSFRKFQSDTLDEYTLIHLSNDLKQCSDRSQIRKLFDDWQKIADQGVVHDAERLYKKLGEVVGAA